MDCSRVARQGQAARDESRRSNDDPRVRSTSVSCILQSGTRRLRETRQSRAGEAPVNGRRLDGRSCLVISGRAASLRLVVLIVDGVSFGQHALMQDARNKNAATLLAVEHDVSAMLMTAQAGANVI